MNPNEINFTFAGKHCLRDFGCVWVERDGRPFAPAITRNSYEIAGTDGTALLPGETRSEMEISGTLVLVQEPRNQHEAQQRMREIARWLMDGRKQLIYDYEPERYYLAQVDDELTWSLGGWFGGEIGVTFKMQPCAYNLHADKASARTTGNAVKLGLTVRTQRPAPLEVIIKNTGGAPITGAAITAQGKRAVFEAMSLAADQSLTVTMEPPIGAVFSTGESALPFAHAFDHITLDRGAQTVDVALTYGSGTPGATVTASARGRC